MTIEEVDNDAVIEFLMQKLDYYENLNKTDINKIIEDIPTYIFIGDGDDIGRNIDEYEDIEVQDEEEYSLMIKFALFA